MVKHFLHVLVTAAVLAGPLAPAALAYEEPASLKALVAEGKLPPVDERLPILPQVSATEAAARSGGDIRWVGASVKDVRMMNVYGYARLIVFTQKYGLEPDILESYAVEDGERRFIFRLRPGLRWSDGQPFTSEDFRYFWEDVARNKELSPTGAPAGLVVEGELPKVTFPDAFTVIYQWNHPHPTFLAELAGAAPLYIYRPAHYLKQFHARYQDPEVLAKKAKDMKARSWAALHNRLDNQYRNDNPDLPTLDPWVNRTKAPAERFVFERNPYFHRVDTEGRQLPYLDRIIMGVADSKIVPVKTGAGESDWQARYLMFDNYAFLRQAAKRHNATVHLWDTGRGATLALYPNLTVADPVWRSLLRDVRFRRALSMGIDRYEINQVVYYGLGRIGNNTMLPGSPLFNEDNSKRWAGFDRKAANQLLDEIGLKRESPRGQRLLPDGRPLTIVVESGGDSADQSDALHLVRDAWQELGIKLLTKSMQSDVFRNRVFAGETVFSIAPGAENGLAHAGLSPAEWAPTQQIHWQWSQWGNFVESHGKAGQPVDMPEAEELLSLYKEWRRTDDPSARSRIWERMLAIHADQQFVIGLVAGVPQPVWVNNRLHGLPARGMYNWEPGAHFGVYRPDLLWLESAPTAQVPN